VTPPADAPSPDLPPDATDGPGSATDGPRSTTDGPGSAPGSATSPASAAAPASVAIAFIAHGSRAAAANEAHIVAAAALADRLGAAVVAGFLELAEPSIPEAIAAAAASGADRVLVLPLFLYPGRHVAEDIPALVDAGRARVPGVSVEVLDPFGADPAIIDLLATQVRAALA
jgi:sirohydrochlorin ferrochelatase